MPIAYEIVDTPETHDSDDIRMHGKYEGFGYRSKEDGGIGLIRCPDCGRENYAMSVASGVCCWCGFKANKPLI